LGQREEESADAFIDEIPAMPTRKSEFGEENRVTNVSNSPVALAVKTCL
jgi:hypothetical protein